MPWRERDGERENRPGAFRPEAWWTDELVVLSNIKVRPTFSVWSGLAHRAEGADHNHNRRKLRSIRNLRRG